MGSPKHIIPSMLELLTKLEMLDTGKLYGFSVMLPNTYQFAGADADWRVESAFAVDGLGGAAHL
jgi:hypothetical protein